MLDEKRLERCAWASFFIGNNQWLVGRWKTHVGWCVVMKFRGCCSFVVRKMRESIHLKNEKLWHHLKMILD